DHPVDGDVVGTPPGRVPIVPLHLCVPKTLEIRTYGDAARQPGRATRSVRSAESGERPERPGPMTGVFAQYWRTLAGSDADASRPAPRCGPRTHDGAFRSTARRTNSAMASPLQWVCRESPWLVIGA